MTFCGPSCTIPSCASSPVVGFGSPYSLGCGYGGLGYCGLGGGYGGHGCGYGGLGYGFGGLGYGCGGLGSGYGGLGYGFGGLGYGYGGLGYGGYGYGNVETSSSLGTLRGVFPSCINQLSPSEVVIKPPASIVTIPGPVLSSTCEPVAVGGNTPCAVDPFGDGLLGGRYGYGLGGRYGYGLGGRYGYARGPCFGFPWRRSLLAGSRIYGCPC